MLGSRSEADDAVQEAWLRLSRSDASEIENWAGGRRPSSRECRSTLRSRASRREESVGDSPPDDVETPAFGSDPEHEANLADTVGARCWWSSTRSAPRSGSRSCCTHVRGAVRRDRRIIGRTSTAANLGAEPPQGAGRASYPTPIPRGSGKSSAHSSRPLEIATSMHRRVLDLVVVLTPTRRPCDGLACGVPGRHGRGGHPPPLVVGVGTSGDEAVSFHAGKGASHRRLVDLHRLDEIRLRQPVLLVEPRAAGKTARARHRGRRSAPRAHAGTSARPGAPDGPVTRAGERMSCHA